MAPPTGPRTVLALTLMLAALGPGPSRAQATVAEFYRGKTVSLVVSTAAGSGYDFGARVLGRHLGRHIPGNPTVIVQNRPGGGGRTGTAFVYSVAPKDGTVIGAVQSFIATDPLLDPSVLQLFDPRRFEWLGSIANTSSVAIAWHDAPVKEIKDLYQHELVVGGVGSATPVVTMPYLFHRLLGMKFSVVAGYESGNEVNLALERGEVKGRIDYSWHSLKAEHQDWIAAHKINLLFQIGLRAHPDLESLPLVIDLAKSAEDRQILQVIFLNYEFGRAFMLAPGVPAERIAALRSAFVATMADADFLADAEKSKLEVSPVSAARLAQLVEEAYRLPPALVQRAIALQAPDSK
jgi:tripartite-type tricarboxylate transporter receptor subunit TctC